VPSCPISRSAKAGGGGKTPPIRSAGSTRRTWPSAGAESLHITLVKKIKADGSPCRQSAEVVERLDKAQLLGRICP